MAEWLNNIISNKDSFFMQKNQRNVLESQSKVDCLRSAFHLIRARNGTFSQSFRWDKSSEQFREKRYAILSAG
ncbi:hypothetical protein [Ligilactobacillus ruminis]|uniref:hypothetical protein n=1 Tax=Ligilactobacillus ruminis TaxID=1623 RepID=UPI003F98A294